jgi:Tfp pilus assembly protein PilV
MLRTIDRYKNDRGYILLMVVVMMLVMAVMAMGMNRRAGMQAKMAANQTRSSQTHLGQIAALEEAAWTLNRNPAWRTSSAGASYGFNGITYNRTVLDASGYSDVVTVTVSTPGGLKQLSTSFRLIEQTVISYLIADTENHRIRRVDIATGLITTFAGNGSAGHSGDDGLAINASMDKSRSVWAGAFGIVYIADTDNDCIRKIDAAETITTVAGIGRSHGFSGDGGDATNAQLDKPHGVWVDSSENIYVADTNNHVIRKVDGATGIITTVAGIGKQNGYTGDGGLATAAELNKPRGVYVDPSGNIYGCHNGYHNHHRRHRIVRRYRGWWGSHFGRAKQARRSFLRSVWKHLYC